MTTTSILIVSYLQDKYMNGAYGMSFTAQLNLVPEQYKAMFTRCYKAHEHLHHSYCG